MSEESIAPPSTTDESFYQKVSYFRCIYDLKFKGICFKQSSLFFIKI